METALASAHTGATAQQLEETVANLRRSDIFREYQKAFQTATGLPLVMRTAGSFESPMHGARQGNAFCAIMAAMNKSCAACLQVQQKIEDASHEDVCTVECFAGLSESAVPIRMGAKVLAYLQTGQILLHAPTAKQFARTSRQLAEWGTPVETKELETAYFKTRVLPKVQYDSILRLITIFAQHLSSLSNQLMVQQATAEAPPVTKARAYIAAHQGEELSLVQVAKAVNMSPYYFCKVFKKATGLTFVEYLSRVRIEKVKDLLLNPHTRVSEAAFEAGFQSLSQFNRVFRRVAGEAPSDYRERLHGEGSRPNLVHAA
ncbi:MAG: helix-turn-helix domain-containing protein [Opitutaceae bacterium]|nr:helix-turn-helix domain-containing protein [Opitutaceae bacterium]